MKNHIISISGYDEINLRLLKKEPNYFNASLQTEKAISAAITKVKSEHPLLK
jgi:hypothetical protein